MRKPFFFVGILALLTFASQTYASGSFIGSSPTENAYYSGCDRREISVPAYVAQSFGSSIDVALIGSGFTPMPGARAAAAFGIADLIGRLATGPTGCTGVFGVDDTLVLGYAWVFDHGHAVGRVSARRNPEARSGSPQVRSSVASL